MNKELGPRDTRSPHEAISDLHRAYKGLRVHNHEDGIGQVRKEGESPLSVGYKYFEYLKTTD